MKNILFGITSLTLGGAEKVLIDIINELNYEYKITVFTLYGKGELEKNLPEDVEIKNLYSNSYNEMSRLKKICISLRLLLFKKHIYNKYIKDNYDTEVAFLEGPITSLFGVKNKNTKKIAWVHTDISKIFGDNFKAKIKQYLNRAIYNKYNKIIFVSKDSKEKFETINPNINKDKLEVIYNYINKANVINMAQEEVEIPFKQDEINFVLAARLVEVKAIDRLIRVHEKLIQNNYKHQIFILGDGPLKESLQKQINEREVEKSFHLLGAKENPYPYIKNADYVCSLSYFEGYSMLAEQAKILNKYVIITNTAAREAVENYKNSVILENNEEAIYEGLKDIIENRQKYESKVDTKEEYSNIKIIEQIKEIIG